jgi:hypothetical protein
MKTHEKRFEEIISLENLDPRKEILRKILASEVFRDKAATVSGHRKDSSTADGRKKRQKTLYRNPDSELAQILLSNLRI